jgi:hypothetical protein
MAALTLWRVVGWQRWRPFFLGPQARGDSKLMVYGANNCGKSTFINAMLGRPGLLPSGNGRVTGRILEIRHAPEGKQFVGVQDPATGELEDVQSLEDCADEDAVEKRVHPYLARPAKVSSDWASRRVVLGLAHPLLAAGVTLVDPPGVSGVDDREVQQCLTEYLKNEVVHVLFCYDNAAFGDGEVAAAQVLLACAPQEAGDMPPPQVFFVNTRADLRQIRKEPVGGTDRSTWKELLDSEKVRLTEEARLEQLRRSRHVPPGFLDKRQFGIVGAEDLLDEREPQAQQSFAPLEVLLRCVPTSEARMLDRIGAK